MYLYRVSEGEYDMYMEEILIHDRQFTEEEFAELVKESNETDFGDIADHLCEKHSFKRAEFTAGVHSGYSRKKGDYLSFVGTHKANNI